MRQYHISEVVVRSMILRKYLLSLIQCIKEEQNTIEIKGIVAMKMNDEQIESFKASLDEILGKKTKLSIKVDPSLIGGIKLRVDNTFLDASIYNKLQTLRTELLQT